MPTFHECCLKVLCDERLNRSIVTRARAPRQAGTGLKWTAKKILKEADVGKDKSIGADEFYAYLEVRTARSDCGGN